MQISNWVKVTALCLTVSGLTACHTLSGGKNASDASQEGAQTSGLGDQDGISNDRNSANRLKAPYNQTYLFEFNKYDVQSEDVASVNVQANYLVAHAAAKIRLEGNADERGSREYNIALGWKRAKAVAELLKQQGVSDTQIAMVSYGKEKPVALGHDEEAYRLNRRVELVYEAK